MAKKSEHDQERSGGFTMVRNGLREHIEAGMFSPTELGIYSYIQYHANFQFQALWTNASSIATGFHHPSATQRIVQEAMQKMRTNRYIDYPLGGYGKGQSFPVLILKGEPTLGVLKGSRLIGFTSTSYAQARYVFPNAARAQAVLKSWVGVYLERMHAVGCPCAECAQPVSVGVSLQDLRLGRTPKLEKLENLKDGEEENIAPAYTSLLDHMKPFVGSAAVGELVEDEVEVKK